VRDDAQIVVFNPTSPDAIRQTYRVKLLEPQRARILAAAATAKNLEEISANHTAMVQEMIQDAKAAYMPTMPLLDETIEQLNSAYRDLIKIQEEQASVK